MWCNFLFGGFPVSLSHCLQVFGCVLSSKSRIESAFFLHHCRTVRNCCGLVLSISGLLFSIFFAGCDFLLGLAIVGCMFSFCPGWESVYSSTFGLSNFGSDLIVEPRPWFSPCCSFAMSSPTFYWLCSLSHFGRSCRLPLSRFGHDRAKNDSGFVSPFQAVKSFFYCMNAKVGLQDYIGVVMKAWSAWKTWCIWEPHRQN